MTAMLNSGRPQAAGTARPRGRVVHYIELQELILTMGLALVIVGAAFEAGFKTWRMCSDYSKRATDCSEIEILRRNWRAFVRTFDAEPELRGPASLVAGARRAQIADREIVLESPARTRTLRVPAHMTATLDLEDGGSGACLVVLTVHTESRVGDATRTRRSRIVACPPPGTAHRTQGGTP